jgi:non-specific serine/threonine protein kinase
MYHSRRNEQPARDYFNRARIVCAQLDDHTGIADALSSLGWLMAEYDELDAGIAILEEAVTLQRRLGGGVGLSRALGNLTFLLGARKGNWSRAQPLLEESYALSASVADAWSIAHGFVLLARAAGAVGKPYVAAQLLGAGQHLLSRIQADWYPSVGQDFRDSLDQAQAALGQERFAAAFREGGQLPTAEAFGLGVGMIREAAMRERRHVGPQLTKREGEVADRVAGGRTNGEIARELVVSERTVEKHMSAILTKLNFRSRAQVAAWITARSNSTTTSSPTGAETGPRSRQRKSGSSSG